MTCEEKYKYIEKVINSCTKFEQLLHISDWILHVMKDCNTEYSSILINYLKLRLSTLDERRNNVN